MSAPMTLSENQILWGSHLFLVHSYVLGDIPSQALRNRRKSSGQVRGGGLRETNLSEELMCSGLSAVHRAD